MFIDLFKWILELALALVMAFFACVTFEWTLDLFYGDGRLSFRVFLMSVLTTLLSLQMIKIIYVSVVSVGKKISQSD